ncbi:MAG: SDR family NAD(P)-dependent oxidoreductase [Myxococcales bacterium]|nr:MAG: SDR family NAD(P)-dependent oxidoreductase [Myxococcales bacterium]
MGLLDGATAIVTGATRGVGRGCALELASQGVRVYITGRTVHEGDSQHPGSLESAAEEARALGGELIGIVCDHRDDDQVRAAFERVTRERGRLDLLVNNAFLIPDELDPKAPFWESSLACWDDMHSVGLRSAYVGTWLAAPGMVRQRRGLVVNVSSQGARYFAVHPAYGAAKAGLDRMTRDTAHQLEPHGVAAVALWPAYVTTERILALDAAEWGLDLDGAESPRFAGRAIAALLADPQVIRRSWRSYTTRRLADAYGFVDVDGALPKAGPEPLDPGPLLPPG